MTSNVGLGTDQPAPAAPVGFGTGDRAATGGDELRERLMRRLRETFRPEFLNRIDEIIMFRRLEAEQLRADHRAAARGDPAPAARPGRRRSSSPRPAIDWLAEHGYQPEFGARPMRRTIQREVDNRLSRMLLGGQLPPGGAVTVDAADDGLRFDIHTGQSAAVGG